MPRKVIAVEENLSHIRAALEKEGYRIVGPKEKGAAQAGVVVLSGVDENLLGQAERKTAAPVIEARGRTAEEVVREVKKFL